MLMSLITGGTTSIAHGQALGTDPRAGRYHGFLLNGGNYTLSLFDSLGSTGLAIGTNMVDFAIGTAGFPLDHTPGDPEPGIAFFNGLQATLTSGGTACIYWS